MTLFLFLLGAVFFLVLAWVLYYHNIELFACLLIAVNFEFFFILPMLGRFPVYRLMDVMLVRLLVLVRLLRGDLALGRYGFWVLLLTPISLMAILKAYCSGQSLLLGVKATKFVPLLLSYFLFVGKDVNPERFAFGLVIMAVGISAMVVAHSVFANTFNPFWGLSTEMREALITERLGRSRNAIGSFAIAVAGVSAFACFLRSRYPRLVLIAAIALFLEIVFVTQVRMLIIVMMVAMLFLYVRARRLSMPQVCVLISVLLLMIVAWDLLSTQMIRHSELAALTTEELTRKTGSVEARLATYAYYWKGLLKDPLLGSGALNFDWVGNPERWLQEQGIHLSDIGVMHFFVKTGFIGFLWFALGLLLMWKDSFFHGTASIATGYLVMATIAMPTLDFFLRNDTMLLFGIFSALLSNEVNRSLKPFAGGGKN